MARQFDVLETLVEQARDPARGWYRVRWAVDGRERCKLFVTRALADAFLGILKEAASDGTPFDPATGLPALCRPAPLLSAGMSTPGPTAR